MNKAIILDRDGTINVEKNYLYKIEDFEFTYRAEEAIKSFKDNGYIVIVITNQAGIARGYYNEGQLEELHQWINKELYKYQTRIDEFLYCPHHPTAGKGEYKIECNCRKPNTYLYEYAINKFDIDVNKSYVIGDKITDLKPGNELGMKTILVETGYGKKEMVKNSSYDLKFENLYEASLYINSREGTD